MINEENILNAIGTLGEVIEMKECGIKWRDEEIEKKNRKIADLEAIIAKQSAEILKKDSTIADLEERIAIMTESEAPEESTDFAPDPELKKEGE